MVADRFWVREDLALRLAESFRDGLDPLRRHQKLVVPMDGGGGVEPMTFSANFACPECGYFHVGARTADLPPSTTPAGACPTCDGLGVQQYFDPAKLIHDPSQSLAGGAIRGWDKRSFYYFQMLKSLAEHSISSIWSSLGGSARQGARKYCCGLGQTEIEFRYMNDRGDVVVRKHPFEDLAANMERRYRETESNSVREELPNTSPTGPAIQLRRQPFAGGGASRIRR